MKKLFISQPMNGKTEEEIIATREKAVQSVERLFGKVEVIDSFFRGASAQESPLLLLAKSLELLSTADIAYFANGWENARGCRIENLCAFEYGITVMTDGFHFKV